MSKEFKHKTTEQKITHIKKCMEEALPEVNAVTCLADILDVWECFTPWLISEVEDQDKEIKDLKDKLKQLANCIAETGYHFLVAIQGFEKKFDGFEWLEDYFDPEIAKKIDEITADKPSGM